MKDFNQFGFEFIYNLSLYKTHVLLVCGVRYKYFVHFSRTFDPCNIIVTYPHWGHNCPPVLMTIPGAQKRAASGCSRGNAPRFNKEKLSSINKINET